MWTWYNRLLKEVKLEVSIDFICSDNKDLLIITNKVVAFSDINIIEKYLKKLNNINSNKVMSPKLLQSKSYLKILGISYFIKDMHPYLIWYCWICYQINIYFQWHCIHILISYYQSISKVKYSGHLGWYLELPK